MSESVCERERERDGGGVKDSGRVDGELCMRGVEIWRERKSN